MLKYSYHWVLKMHNSTTIINISSNLKQIQQSKLSIRKLVDLWQLRITLTKKKILNLNEWQGFPKQ